MQFLLINSQKAYYRIIEKKNLWWEGATLEYIWSSIIAVIYVAYFVNKGFKIVLKQKKDFSCLFFFKSLFSLLCILACWIFCFPSKIFDQYFDA